MLMRDNKDSSAFEIHLERGSVSEPIQCSSVEPMQPPLRLFIMDSPFDDNSK